MHVISFILTTIRPFRRYVLGAFASIAFYATVATFSPYIIKQIINILTLESSPQSRLSLLYAASGFVLVELAIPLSWRFYDWFTLKYEPDLRNYITSLAFDQTLKHDISFFHRHLSGKLAAKINNLAYFIPLILGILINTFFNTGLTLCFAVVLLWQVHPCFSLLMGIWSVLILLLSFATLSRFNFLTHNTAEATTQIAGNLVDSLSNHFNVRLFSAQKEEQHRLSFFQQSYRNHALARLWFMFKFFSFQGFASVAYQAFCIALLLYLHGQGKVTPGDFALILSYNGWIVYLLWETSEAMRGFSEQWGAVEQALKSLYAPVKNQDDPKALPLQVTRGEISFTRVNFRYDEGSLLFQDKSVHIPAGKKVGLVGYSGSGKSTFVNLILRLYEISEGKIEIDGQDIRTVTHDSLRAAIALIPQDPSLFHRSILENIRYSRPDASDNEVFEAAKRAHAHGFISSLPQGYETLVGERGVMLSGGQRQRIAIARAILKNAPILILDEATSHLDSISEREIQNALWDLMQGKTTLVTAHRLSTLLHMDRILVFDQGKIVEEGTHPELLNSGGLYESLWKAQIDGFLPPHKLELE